ncbi:ficolin-1-like isoform X2 [Ambystoma mexicanum]|uniref:ficolin-1-like isoform X2 n=1 Tax=Ambystoma mexicanum TaxID=8296 RepID=UPI0037E910EA
MWTLGHQIVVCLCWVKLCNAVITESACPVIKVFGLNSASKMAVVRGCPGDLGDIGVQGEEGTQGIKGPNGDQGDHGRKGLRGDTGLRGEPGVPAIPGRIGNTGFKGIKGDAAVPPILEKKNLEDVLCKNGPRSCKDLIAKGITLSGYYTLYIEGCRAMNVLCDMNTDGGGWLVFQRRWDGTVDFYRDWNTYKRGFGTLISEFWLGNENIHKITSAGNYEIRFDLQDFDNNFYFAKYTSFRLGSESEKYKLYIGNFTGGNAGDSMDVHRSMPFTT